MFKGIIDALKVAGRVKAAISAIDDDVDLDGRTEPDELKECLDNLLSLGKEFITEFKRGFVIAAALVEHIAKAIKEA